MHLYKVCIVFFKQKTAYEMRISDWSSDVCSSDLELAEQSPAEVSQAVDIVFAPVELVTAMIGEHQVNEETTLERRFRHFPLFRRELAFRSPVAASFLASSNGHFFMVCRIRT